MDNPQLSFSGRKKLIDYSERKYTASYGGGNGRPLTGNAEGEDIVNAYLKG
jgi:hypothetical protein